jgi:hypothetical protein
MLISGRRSFSPRSFQDGSMNHIAFRPSAAILTRQRGKTFAVTLHRHLAFKNLSDFVLSPFIPGILYLENHLISSLNDYGKRKETPENAYLDSPSLV